MISTTPQSVVPALRSDIEILPDGDTPDTRDSLVQSTNTGRPTNAGRPSTGRPTSGGERARYVTVVMLATAALAAVVIGGFVYRLATTVTVDLTIDGRAQTIETRAATVADLLVQQEITVASDDLVIPAAEAELTDGATIVVRYARPLTVVIDGSEATHRTTELTVGAALSAVGAPVEGAAISLPLDRGLSRSGASVEIITAKSVTVDDGGRSATVTTTARTVADLLADRQITLADTDTVVPVMDTTITENLAVTITRIRMEEEIRTEAIAHDTTETRDGDLTVGTRKVSTEGVDGEREVTYALVYTNGELTSEEEVSSTITREPVTEVVLVGTKPAPAVDPGASAGGAAAGLNWAALAQCESSGNPRAVNPAGYYGLYQFSLPTWRSVGGTGNPIDASPEEQTMRAQILYNKAGVGQWPHCGPRLFT